MTPVARLRLDDQYPGCSDLLVQFDEREGCVLSRVTWSNPDVMAALRRMFALAPTDRITAVEVSPAGITARILREPAPAPAKKGRAR